MAKKKQSASEQCAAIDAEIKALRKKKKELEVAEKRKDEEGFSQTSKVIGAIFLSLAGDWKCIDLDRLAAALETHPDVLSHCKFDSLKNVDDAYDGLTSWIKKHIGRGKYNGSYLRDSVSGKQSSKMPAGVDGSSSQDPTVDSSNGHAPHAIPFGNAAINAD